MNIKRTSSEARASASAVATGVPGAALKVRLKSKLACGVEGRVGSFGLTHPLG